MANCNILNHLPTSSNIFQHLPSQQRDVLPTNSTSSAKAQGAGLRKHCARRRSESITNSWQGLPLVGWDLKIPIINIYIYMQKPIQISWLVSKVQSCSITWAQAKVKSSISKPKLFQASWSHPPIVIPSNLFRSPLGWAAWGPFPDSKLRAPQSREVRGPTAVYISHTCVYKFLPCTSILRV